MSSNTPARRFKPEPYETTTSKGGKETSPDPAEATPKKTRKFAVEPVETSTRRGGGAESEAKETAGAESKTSGQKKDGPRRRFVPEPLETAKYTNRKSSGPSEDEEPPLLPHEKAVESQDFAQKPAKRRFKPELIGTATRSRRAGDAGPAVRLEDKTNANPGDANLEPRKSNTLPASSQSNSQSSSIRVPEFPPQRQSTLHAHNNTRANTGHSFKVPSLEAIESSGSDRSDPPSLSDTHSAGTDATEEHHKDATRMRESDDDKFSGYLLALAARAAGKQLREQAAAAFPNSDQHDTVTHFMNRSSSDGSSSSSRAGTQEQLERLRQGSDDEQAALEELQRHGEAILKKKQEQQRKLGNFDSGTNANGNDTSSSPTTKNKHVAGYEPAPKRMIGGHQRDHLNLKQMRKAACPPMLGGDIYFPRCPSPEHAKFDITQGADYLKENMDKLGPNANAERGLWGVEIDGTSCSEKPITPKGNDPQAGGLWGGFCTLKDARPAKQPSGIVTPKQSPSTEKDDPFSVLNMTPATNAPASVGRRGPVSPPPSSTNLAALASSPGKHDLSSSKRVASRVEIEEKVRAEFTDGFITQVYNYLSLGYPALARKYDDELARISGMKTSDLRTDDEMAAAGSKGYIRLGYDEDVVVDAGTAQAAGKQVLAGDETEEEVHIEPHMCARWRALRLYVHEWGHQMVSREKVKGERAPSLDPHRAWGLPQRRGSWGL